MDHKKHFSGLTTGQVIESRKKFGSNLLTPPKRDPLWKLFLEKFEDPIIRILLIAAFLSLGIAFIHNAFAETIGIFFAIFLATGVAFAFETDANRKFDILNQVNDDTLMKVIRNGNISEIQKKEIVVGDIVLLGTGEEVPADGLLLEAVSLQIDESCLTGEPIIDKTTNFQELDKEAAYPSNWAMRGTKVMDGHATLEVKSVGDATEYGKVAQKSTEIGTEETPLKKQLDGLAKLISVIGFGLAILTFIILFVKNLVFGSASYSLTQLGSVGIVIFTSLIALSKAWIPILYDGYKLLGVKKELPVSIKEKGWLAWFGYSVFAFLLIILIGFTFGIDPSSPDSWVSIEIAGNILRYFMISVTLIVVAVPEGLPMSVTLSLALSMRKMLQMNNLVRKMHACETIGATTVICTDKTGTLTQNRMQVAKTNFFGLKNQQLTQDETSNLITEGIAVNSTAYLDFSDNQTIKTLGNPTESALLLWLHGKEINYLELRDDATVVEQLTFSTERKFMATIVHSPLINKKVLYVKGAPEIVLALCNDVIYEDTRRTVDVSSESIENLLLHYQNQAMRTLGFAFEIIEDEKERIVNGNLVNTNLTYLGVVAISDPVRPDVPEAVKNCLNAGIDIKIVTGDTAGTAKEIGRQIGVWTESDNSFSIITGAEFEALSNEEAVKRLKFLKIMCRARPTDKQRLVQLLQTTGSIVAVTGDGTNDAPPLNFAHVGLSMGSGTSVAKEASDITLLDDSFSSIATAVMWGRSLYQNIQRFILFQLTINVAALVTVLLGSVFGRELPLTVTQMLWVNLIMDTFAAGALASLPPNDKVMKDKPRKNDDFIITPAMRTSILSVGFAFVGLLLFLIYFFTDKDGNISKYDLSRFFTFFVMLQFWNMFNAKAFATGKSAFYEIKKSVGFLIVAAIIFVGQVLIVEFGGEVFRTVPLSLADWILIIIFSSLVLWIGELRRRFSKS
ncbi:MAG: calcium-translocating P-type ATPase, PMCA-type [Mariniphaga sp.]